MNFLSLFPPGKVYQSNRTATFGVWSNEIPHQCHGVVFFLFLSLPNSLIKIHDFHYWRVDLTSDTQQRHRCRIWRCNSSSKAAERPVSSQQPSLSPVAHLSFSHSVATLVVLSFFLSLSIFLSFLFFPFNLSCGTYCHQRRDNVRGRVT